MGRQRVGLAIVGGMMLAILPYQSHQRSKAPRRLSSLLFGAASASAYRRAEDVGIEAIVVAELKFRNVERHIFGAHFVESADHAAFEDRPEALDCLSVDCANHVLAFGMVNRRVRIFLVEFPVALPLIGAEQANLVRNGLAYEVTERISADVFDHAGDDVTLALDRTNDRRFAGTDAASPSAFAALVLVLVFRQTADEGFVNFDDTAEFRFWLNECSADFVRHVQRGFIGAETHDSLNLKARNSLFAGQHKVHDPEPLPERLVRVLEDRPGDVRETIASLRSALVALPTPRMPLQFGGVFGTTARATDTLGPATANQIGATGFFVGKHSLELGDGK